MKQLSKISMTLILMIILTNEGFSQLSAAYYYAPQSKIGLAYNFSDKIWSELKYSDESNNKGSTLELGANFNIVRKDRHFVYLGLASDLGDLGNVTVPVGIQFSPIEKLDRFSLQIELQTLFDSGDDVSIKNTFGIRYQFGT